MNKPANRCVYILTKEEELAEVAKVCLPYSKIASNFACNSEYNFICETVNKARNKNKHIHYKYKKIGVV